MTSFSRKACACNHRFFFFFDRKAVLSIAADHEENQSSRSCPDELDDDDDECSRRDGKGSSRALPKVQPPQGLRYLDGKQLILKAQLLVTLVILHLNVKRRIVGGVIRVQCQDVSYETHPDFFKLINKYVWVIDVSELKSMKSFIMINLSLIICMFACKKIVRIGKTHSRLTGQV
uniref:Uncharacterized protein n=1 Tax=Strigamia maritima TaxID=126957 RepID=T1JA72_STRMM